MEFTPRFEHALKVVLEHEGGWANHPDDPGGATMMGVTKATWESWVGHKVSNEQLAELTINDIKPLYWTRYYKPVKADALPAGVALQTFDISVNSGPRRAGIILQDSIRRVSRVGLIKDGIIGRKTVDAAKACDPIDLINEIGFRRLTFYSALRNFETFKDGWRKRTIGTTSASVINSITSAAQDLAQEELPFQPIGEPA